MLSREEIREFFRFLDTASDRELAEKRKELEAMIGIFSAGSDHRRDAMYYLRRLTEEQAARLTVQLAKARRKARQQ